MEGTPFQFAPRKPSTISGKFGCILRRQKDVKLRINQTKKTQHWSPSTFPGLCIVLINVLSNGDTNDNMIMEGMEFACKYIFSGARLALFWELLVSLSLLSPRGAQTFWSCLSLLLIFTISLFSFLFYFPALPFLRNLLSIQRQTRQCSKCHQYKKKLVL